MPILKKYEKQNINYTSNSDNIVISALDIASRLLRAVFRNRRKGSNALCNSIRQTLPDVEMKILSLIQPWASLVVGNIKDVENRSWPTNIRGKVGIAASARKSAEEWDSAVMTVRQVCQFEYHEDAESWLIALVGEFNELPRSAIIGTAEIVDCKRAVTSPWHFDGNWGFYLRNAKMFDAPIPAKGKLGFWDFANL